MAAGEDETQSLVGDHVGLLWLPGEQRCKQLVLACERLLAPNPVDGAVPRRRQQPGTGARGGAVTRPALERRCECVLNRILGELHVAKGAREDRERAPPLLPEDVLDYAP